MKNHQNLNSVPDVPSFLISTIPHDASPISSGLGAKKPPRQLKVYDLVEEGKFTRINWENDDGTSVYAKR